MLWPTTPWDRKAKIRDVSPGPLACPFARLLAPLTRSLALHCSLRSLRSLTHSQACGKAWFWCPTIRLFCPIVRRLYRPRSIDNSGSVGCRAAAHLRTPATKVSAFARNEALMESSLYKKCSSLTIAVALYVLHKHGTRCYVVQYFNRISCAKTWFPPFCHFRNDIISSVYVQSYSNDLSLPSCLNHFNILSSSR